MHKNTVFRKENEVYFLLSVRNVVGYNEVRKTLLL